MWVADTTRNCLECFHSELSGLTLVDLAIDPSLASSENITTIQGSVPDVLAGIENEKEDIILCINHLEHLWNPERALQEIHRILKKGGTLLLNVPSWRGKWFLEFISFDLKLGPPDEMDDHKNYYDLKDLWPLLVKTGFKPSKIKIFSHKFGLSTFAVCNK